MKTDNLTDEQKILYMLDKLGDALRGMYSRMETVHREIERIERLGWTDAKPHYRDGKYLYLIHPMRDGERQREYIGGDPEKILDALAKIERKTELEKWQSQMSNLQFKIFRLRSQVSSLLTEVYQPE